MDATADVSEIPWLFPHKCKFPWPNELTNSKNSFWRTQPPLPHPSQQSSPRLIYAFSKLRGVSMNWENKCVLGHIINPWNIDQACSMKVAGYSWYWPRSFLRFYCVFIGQYLAILTTRLDNNAFFLPEQWVISRQKNMLGSAMPQLLRTIKAVGYGE